MLDLYNKIAKEQGITEDLNVSDIAKLSFVREQANQMKQIVNRLVFDLTMTQARLDEAKDENTIAAYKQKINQYEGDLRQTRDGLKSANELVKDLENALGNE